MTPEQIEAYNFIHLCMKEYIQVMQNSSPIAGSAIATVLDKHFDVLKNALEQNAQNTFEAVVEATKKPKAKKTVKAVVEEVVAE